MIKSMTGFGRGTIEEAGIGYNIEIKSVNHRYLDVSIKMPRSLNPVEDKIRKKISEKISRGKVDLFVTQKKSIAQNEKASVNFNLANSYVDCLNEIKERYNIKEDISLSLISKYPDVIVLEQTEDSLDRLWDVFQKPLEEAIDSFILMRIAEGEKLKDDILYRCNNISQALGQVEEISLNVVANYKDKLNKRLKDLLKDAPIDENRIATELAIYADKSSIDEEIVRLKSHICQVIGTLDLNEPIGRKLDFIVQEMNREANTITSKSDDLHIVNLTLNIKNDIEKIREQVQNVE